MIDDYISGRFINCTPTKRAFGTNPPKFISGVFTNCTSRPLTKKELYQVECLKEQYKGKTEEEKKLIYLEFINTIIK